MNTERGVSTGNNRNFTVLARYASDPHDPAGIALLLFLFFSLALFYPPSLSYVLPHNADGSHRSAELLMRFDIEPVTLRNLKVTDGRNGRAARIPCPRDLQQFVSGYVPAVLHAESLQSRE